ncbi:DUF493 domain-containing protein [Woeseiaceae bacterium]|nr:DUF493 domain-containing protein [Woeseiaceae bacterium]
MNDKVMTKQAKSESLIDFPCEFPIKVLGRDDANFYCAAKSILTKHAQTIPDNDIKKNSSKKGNYMALTCVVNVNNQIELDQIYIDFSKNDHILYVL